MSAEPRAELFEDVADQLERGSVVMSLQWLQNRNVGPAELEALQRRLALVIRGYNALRPAEQIAFVTRGVLSERPIRDQSAQVDDQANQSPPDEPAETETKPQ